MRIIIIFVLLQWISINVFAQYNLVQTVEYQSVTSTNVSSYDIPFQKYKFNNDLTLIINEDHSEPLVSAQFLFKVGSSACNADMTGAMYLIYLLLSENQNAADIIWMKKNGISLKSKLTKDFMSFQLTAPKNLFQTAYWYQAKKFTEFISTVDLNSFNAVKEKAIREVMTKNSTYQEMGFDLAVKSLYPFGHPYSWPIYGFVPHYDIIGLNEIKKFYTEWIGVNNLIISVSGDVVTTEALAVTDKYFSKFMKAANSHEKIANTAFSTAYVENPKSNSNRYASTIIDNESFTNPVLFMVYPGCTYAQNARYILDYAADILGNERYGILKQFLIQSNMANQVSVSNYSMSYGGYFIVKVVATQNYPLSKLKDTIDYFVSNTFSVLDKEERNMMKNQMQIMKDDGTIVEFDAANPKMLLNIQLPKFTALSITNLYSGLESTAQKAYTLAKYDFYLNNPSQIKNEYQQIFELTPQKVNKTAMEYLSNAYPLIVSLLPIDQSKYKPASDNYKSIDLQTVVTPVTDEEIAKISSVSFTEKMPKSGKPFAFIPPSKNITVLENGLKYSLTQNTESPLLDVLIATDISALRKVAPISETPALLCELMKEKIKMGMNGHLMEQIELSGINYNVFIKDDVFYLHFELLPQYMHFLREIIRELIVSQNPTPGIDFESIVLKMRDKEKEPQMKNVGKNLLFVQ